MARIAPAIKRAATLYARRLKDPRAARAAMDRLIPDPAGTGATLADIVIEAISEQPEGQARAVSRAGTAHEARRGASHQYVQPVSGNAARGTGAARASGGHPLLQSRGQDAAGGSGARRRHGGRCAGARQRLRRPDRQARPAGQERARLSGQRGTGALHTASHAQRGRGVAPAAIDAALVAFGMPMGPLELADTVGLDIARAAGESWPAARSRRAAWRTGCRAASWAARPARASMPGATASPSGQGVRRRPAGLAAGLIQPLIDPAAGRSGIVADADLADAGVIFGTGFAPSRAVPCIIKAGPRRSAVEEIRLTPIDRAAEPGSAITTPIQHEEAVP